MNEDELQAALTHWIYKVAPLRVIDAWRDHKWMHGDPYLGVAESMAAEIVNDILSEHKES